MHNALMIVRQHSPDKLRVKAQYQDLSKMSSFEREDYLARQRP